MLYSLNSELFGKTIRGETFLFLSGLVPLLGFRIHPYQTGKHSERIKDTFIQDPHILQFIFSCK